MFMQEYRSMKMIFTLITLLIMFFTMQAFACPLDKSGQITGGACSIKDISKLEKSKKIQEKVNFNIKEEKNLRPVKINSEITKPDERSCIFCLQEGVLRK